MARTTAIAWCDSTFNPWIGCARIGPGCDGCYAAVSTPARARKIEWGTGKMRHRTTAKNWQLPLRWNAQGLVCADCGEPVLDRGDCIDCQCGQALATGSMRKRRVFCASLADIFDNEVPQGWRADLWELIEETPTLEWLLVTKRIGNVRGMVPTEWLQDSAHPERDGFPKNVRLLITVCNQEEADRDIPKMLALHCKNGLSMEPLLGPVNFAPWLTRQLGEFVRSPQNEGDLHAYPETIRARIDGIEWIIVGGESDQPGHKARPFHIQWARTAIKQCKAACVPVFMKQMGAFVIDRNDAGFEGDGDDRWPEGTADKLVFEPFGYVDNAQSSPVRIKLIDRAGADPIEWPEDLRVMEFPND
jgi:protein gp37